MFPTGRKKPVSATPKEMEWAQMACHRCLVYLGDLGNNKIIEYVINSTICRACRGVRQNKCHSAWENLSRLYSIAGWRLFGWFRLMWTTGMGQKCLHHLTFDSCSENIWPISLQNYWLTLKHIKYIGLKPKTCKNCKLRNSYWMTSDPWFY